MKKILISVSNDLYNDNRILRCIACLSTQHYKVEVICKNATKQRNRENFLFYKEFNYLKITRLRFLFKRNVFYYAELNIKLFFTLLFKRFDILYSVDLDTLLPNYLISKIYKKKLIYDAHEMFCYMVQLKNGSIQQKTWLFIERMILPNLKYIITVCDPIKEYFYKNYKVDSIVIRNIAEKKEYTITNTSERYIIWQGATNIDRGLEELILSMHYIDNLKLKILGKGDVFEKIKTMINKENLNNKVELLGKIPFGTMINITANALLGISIDKPTNTNQTISLPNKIFEYINVCLPCLYSPLPEIKKLQEQYNCGVELISYNPQILAKQITAIISDTELLNTLKENCKLAQKVLNWQNEKEKLITFIKTI